MRLKELKEFILPQMDYYYKTIGQSFLTGSYVYGKFGSHSDLDLVVAMSPDIANDLRKKSDNQPQFSHHYPSEMCLSLRFGIVNLLCVFTKPMYMMWREGTSELLARKIYRDSPVTKQEAIEVFDRLRKEHKL